jgi:hypothetical protein
VKTCKLAVLLLILVLLTPVNVGAAPANVKIPPECFAIPHHVKYDLSGYIASGAGMTWVDKATNSITYAVQLTECGGAWFYQISRSGNFQTQLLPARERLCTTRLLEGHPFSMGVHQKQRARLDTSASRRDVLLSVYVGASRTWAVGWLLGGNRRLGRAKHESRF